MKNNLSDIFNLIKEQFNSPGLSSVLKSIAESAASEVNPTAGILASGAIGFLRVFDDYKLNQLVKGLSSGLDQEKKINELYNYVKSSSKRAFLVGNVFRMTLEAESPKSCVLYGKILSEHIGKNESDFTNEELIVCNALINATDFDLENFVILMNQCISQEKDGARRIVFNKKKKDIINMEGELNTTCCWCTYNRLFSFNPLEWGGIEGSDMIIDTDYHVNGAADVLLKWIDEVKQIWEYGN